MYMNYFILYSNRFVSVAHDMMIEFRGGNKLEAKREKESLFALLNQFTWKMAPVAC